jgi:hypothetical protein
VENAIYAAFEIWECLLCALSVAMNWKKGSLSDINDSVSGSKIWSEVDQFPSFLMKLGQEWMMCALTMSRGSLELEDASLTIFRALSICSLDSLNVSFMT